MGVMNGPGNVAATIEQLAAPMGGSVGVQAALLGSDWAISFNADRLLPMASTFKVAVAAVLLAEVDAGAASLDETIVIAPSLMMLDGPLADEAPYDPDGQPLGELMTRMLVNSDNSATNAVMARIGGADAVKRWLAGKGLADISVDGDTTRIISRFLGVEPVAAVADNVALRDFVATNPTVLDKGALPDPTFDDDPRDSATPAGLCRLLVAIAEQRVLSPAGSALLLDAMARPGRGDRRIRAGLPGVRVSAKSGTIGGSVNDIGIATLPDGQRLAMAILIGKSAAPIAEREAAIGQIARAIYDAATAGV